LSFLQEILLLFIHTANKAFKVYTPLISELLILNEYLFKDIFYLSMLCRDDIDNRTRKVLRKLQIQVIILQYLQNTSR